MRHIEATPTYKTPAPSRFGTACRLKDYKPGSYFNVTLAIITIFYPSWASVEEFHEGCDVKIGERWCFADIPGVGLKRFGVPPISDAVGSVLLNTAGDSTFLDFLMPLATGWKELSHHDQGSFLGQRGTARRRHPRPRSLHRRSLQVGRASTHHPRRTTGRLAAACEGSATTGSK